MSDDTSPTTPGAGPDQVSEGAPDAGRRDVDQHDVDLRAELLPEERAVGSEDPEAQARAILEESAERTDDPEGTREESVQTPGRDGDGQAGSRGDDRA